MHNDGESVLVICAFIFTVVLYTVVLAKGNRPSITYKGRHFDKSGFPIFYSFLICTLVLNLILGFAVTRTVSVTIAFTFLNLVIATIMGVNIFLVREKEKK